MLNIEQISPDIPESFTVPAMLLLAGAGQNVGKTTFAVNSIRHLKKKGLTVYGLKITPHFHTDEPDHMLIKTADYQVSLEKHRDGKKDSSRMLKAGADEVFFVQTLSDSALAKVFDFVRRMADEKVIWVCESGGLRSVVKPGLFLYFKLKDAEPQKASAKRLMPLADRIVQFDGTDFDFSAEQIDFVKHRFIIKQ
ncbi:MAG: hypothetical protein JW857_03595 [Bacteroidales bacterium]|nr:hypothetical protein [Bacteroidales bacterium]